MTLLPFTEEAEWLRFVPCLVACKLENGSALVEQTPATTENILRIRLPIGDVPVGGPKSLAAFGTSAGISACPWRPVADKPARQASSGATPRAGELTSD